MTSPYMTIVAEGDRDMITYHETAEKAVLAAGIQEWDRALPTLAVNRLAIGDEINITPYSSIILLTGKVTKYHE